MSSEQRDREYEVSFTVTIYAQDEKEAVNAAYDCLNYSNGYAVNVRQLWAGPVQE